MLSSCAGSAALPGVAMCLAFRGDNAGPPEPAEVLQNWALLRTHFPNATAIKAAQLDEYFGLFEPPEVRAKLPVVEAEIADSWV